MDEKWEVEPQTDLDQLVERVQQGEHIELVRGGRTVAKLVPITDEPNLGPPTWAELAEFRRKLNLADDVSIEEMIDDGRRL